jgi:alpha-amylase
VYYGTEASFSGGGDPACREALWPTGFNDNTSGLGSFITTLTGFRKQVQLWDAGAQVQRYADDTFYAFTRGDTFVALTNAGQGGQTQSRTITYHPYPDGQKLCNLFNPSDCVVVEGGAFTVQLVNGAPKVYDPSITQA